MSRAAVFFTFWCLNTGSLAITISLVDDSRYVLNLSFIRNPEFGSIADSIACVYRLEDGEK